MRPNSQKIDFPLAIDSTMSWADTAYVKELKVTPDGPPISTSEQLFVLADYHNEERGEAWVSLARLAEKSLPIRHHPPVADARILHKYQRWPHLP